MPVGVKQRSPLSFVAKPRLSGMRALHSKFGSTSSSQSAPPDRGRKFKIRKATGATRYEQMKKGGLPDYTDYAYKEAVSRLRNMLGDCYIPPQTKYSSHYVSGKGDDSDEESGVSITVSDTTRVAQLGAYRKPSFLSKMSPLPKLSPTMHDIPNLPNHSNPPELMGFIERQEEYIEQLEKESQYCRSELSQLVSKVKDLIAENEALHEQQKSGVYKTSGDGPRKEFKEIPGFVGGESRPKPHLEGPAIVFESRISELEAQLTQARLDVKKAQDEVSSYKRKIMDNDPLSTSSDFYRQIETLQREKKELSDALNRLQAGIADIRERESDASRKVMRTQDVAEKAQLDRQQAELEVQRLKSELELQHERLLDVLSDQTRKVGEERSQAERRYLQHVEQLSSELALQRDAATKLQLELERHQRIEEDLRRDLIAKNATVESVRKELSSKIASLQSELAAALSDRDSLEQELNSNRMSGERSERFSKQESSRLQVEVTALKQRIERTDNELMLSRRDNLRLSEQIASLEKEVTLYKIKIGEMELSEDGTPKKGDSVRELEGLVEKQSQAMTHLSQQCQSLAHSLEDATERHKQEMAELQTNLEFLTGRLESSISARQWQEDAPRVEQHPIQYEAKPGPYEQPQEESPKLYEEQCQSEERILGPAGNASYQPQQQSFRETKVDQPIARPDSANRIADKPPLSRSSSRGERSESPLIRRDSRKSPLHRRESRLQMQQATPPPEYSSPATVPYTNSQYITDESKQEHPYEDDPLKYQSHFPESNPNLQGEYEQPYNPQEQYIPDEMGYDSKAADERNQYQYQTVPGQYQKEPYEYQEQYEKNSAEYGQAEPIYQSQDNYKPEPEIIRNRSPSRESLRSPNQGTPQPYQSTDQARQRNSSSNESISPKQQRYSPKENYDSPQYYQQGSASEYPDNNSPALYAADEGLEYQSSSNPRSPANPKYESPPVEVKTPEPSRTRQSPTLRREPSSASVRQQLRSQQKNLPTKLQ